MSEIPIIGASKPPELTDADINGWLAQQLVALQAALPATIKKMQRSGKYTFHEINTYKATGLREASILEAILRKLVAVPPKQSGVQWKPTGDGGFEVNCFVSGEDLKHINLPVVDADMFQTLIEQNHAVSILSAMALLFGYWERQRQHAEKELIKSIEGGKG